MRCFVPASDDEIYEWIARHGYAGLVAYQPEMLLQPEARKAAATPSPNVLPAALSVDERLAA